MKKPTEREQKLIDVLFFLVNENNELKRFMYRLYDLTNSFAQYTKDRQPSVTEQEDKMISLLKEEFEMDIEKKKINEDEK
jgi:hypothetical protein